MKRAHYMKFVPTTGLRLDRIGGLPTHLPPTIPVCPTSGKPMAFLGQFYCDPERLPLRGALCLHLYQCLGVDDGEEPTPVAIVVPVGAPENTQKQGVEQPTVAPHEVEWEERLDPDSIPAEGMEEDVLALYRAKAGGTIPFQSYLPPNASPLLLLTEQPCNLNLAGLTAVLVEKPDGALEVLLV